MKKQNSLQIEPFDFKGRGHTADKAKPNLLLRKDPNVKVTQLTPGIGTEITGLQLCRRSVCQSQQSWVSLELFCETHQWHMRAKCAGE